MHVRSTALYYLARESGRTFLVLPPPPGKNSTPRVRISTADDANYSFQNQIRSTCRKLRRTFPVGYSTASQMHRQQQQRLPSEVAVVVIDAFESLLSISNHAAPLRTTRYDPSQQKWRLHYSLLENLILFSEFPCVKAHKGNDDDRKVCTRFFKILILTFL